MSSQDADRLLGANLVDVRLAGTSFTAEEHLDAAYGAFWATFATGGFEPATVAVLAAHLGPGRRFVDAGAWIGPFTLLAASLGATVTAIEPDPVAAERLRTNLSLNPEAATRVELRQVALADRSGHVVLDGGALGLGNGLSRLDPLAVRGWAPSTPALGSAEGPGSVQASTASAAGDEVVCIDAAALDLDGVAVLKLDLEGAEFTVVPRLAAALKRHRPVLVLSLHGPLPGDTGRGGGRSFAVRRRLGHAPAMARVLWALRWYGSVSRIDSHRAAGLRPLRWWQRALLCVRLGEMELVCQAGGSDGAGRGADGGRGAGAGR